MGDSASTPAAALRRDAPPASPVPVQPVEGGVPPLVPWLPFRLWGTGAHRRPKAWRLAAETHDCYEVGYLKAGLGTVEVDGAVYTASRGTLVLVAPGVRHRGSVDPSGSTETAYVHVSWPPALLVQYGQWVPHQAVVRLEPSTQSELHAILECILAEAGQNRHAWPLALAAALLDLFAFVVRVGHRLQEGAAGEGSGGPVHRAGEYMHAHFAERLSVAEVARAIGYHPDYLTRIFRQETGLGLRAYLTRVRLEHAAALLADTALPIQAVAGRSGFASTQYLCRLFRRLKGCTPGEYRRSLTPPDLHTAGTDWSETYTNLG